MLGIIFYWCQVTILQAIACFLFFLFFFVFFVFFIPLHFYYYLIFIPDFFSQIKLYTVTMVDIT